MSGVLRYKHVTMAEPRKITQSALHATVPRGSRRRPAKGSASCRVGGRWSVVRALARAKAREVPVRLRSSLVAVLVARWSALLSHAAMSAFAATFTQRAGALSHADGALPPLGELLADAGEAPLAASRLPAG